jgi:hypothetical protein
MEARYFDQLPQVGKELVQSIEGYSAKIIGVVQRDGISGCRIDQNVALLNFGNLNAIPPADAVHELLHVRRNWPERIPLLAATGGVADPRSQVIADIDNDLEHLVISPEQKALGFDPTPHWNGRYNTKWRGRFWENIGNSEDRRAALLLNGLGVDFLTTDRDLKKIVEKTLKSAKLLEVQKRMVGEMAAVLTSKDKMAAVAVHYLAIPRAWVKLVIFDVKAGGEPISSEVPPWPQAR